MRDKADTDKVFSPDGILGYSNVARAVILHAPFVRLTQVGRTTIQDAQVKGELWTNAVSVVSSDRRTNPVVAQAFDEFDPESVLRNSSFSIVCAPLELLPSFDDLYIDKNEKNIVWTRNVSSLANFLYYMHRFHINKSASMERIEQLVALDVNHERSHAEMTRKLLGTDSWVGVQIYRRPFDEDEERHGSYPLARQALHHFEGKIGLWDYIQISLAPDYPSESDYRAVGISEEMYDLRTMTKDRAWRIVLDNIRNIAP